MVWAVLLASLTVAAWLSAIAANITENITNKKNKIVYF